MTSTTLSRKDILIFAAESMKDPLAIKASMVDSKIIKSDSSVPETNWDDLSLNGGYPGLLLLHTSLQQKGAIIGEDIAHRYVIKIKESLEKEGAKNSSLYFGLSGVSYALNQASLGGQRYAKMLESIHARLLAMIEMDYLIPIRNNIRNNQPSSCFLYDVIIGLSGVGRYILEHVSKDNFRHCACSIIQTLIEYCKPLNIKGHLVPGWYLSAEDPSNAQFDVVNGNFNLGLSHGIPGILSLLSSAKLKGLDVDGLDDTIILLANWIRDKAIVKDNMIKWPRYVSFEEETQKSEPKYQYIRNAWCYGTPGVSWALYQAGKALKDAELKSYALHAFTSMFNSMEKKHWKMTGPGLCHGVAGALVLTSQMAIETQSIELKSKAIEFENSLLSLFNPSFPLGFKSVQNVNGLEIEYDNIEFLEGSIGIILALLTAQESSSCWSLPLMI